MDKVLEKLIIVMQRKYVTIIQVLKNIDTVLHVYSSHSSHNIMILFDIGNTIQ